jgi:hypothetical protein
VRVEVLVEIHALVVAEYDRVAPHGILVCQREGVRLGGNESAPCIRHTAYRLQYTSHHTPDTPHHTHTHTHTRTRTRTRTHTHTHTHAPTHSHNPPARHTHTHARTHAHACIHTTHQVREARRGSRGRTTPCPSRGWLRQRHPERGIRRDPQQACRHRYSGGTLGGTLGVLSALKRAKHYGTLVASDATGKGGGGRRARWRTGRWLCACASEYRSLQSAWSARG